MLFYFTATGNSLYVAKQLENDPISIPQELRKANRHYISDSIGIVCPLFEFEIPKLVKDFIQGSSFETDYFYLLITYGCHHGGVAQRTQAWLESIGRKADYVNTIIMHDNALIAKKHRRGKAGRRAYCGDQSGYQRAENLCAGSRCGGDRLLSAFHGMDPADRADVQLPAVSGDGQLCWLRHLRPGMSEGLHPGGQQETGL